MKLSLKDKPDNIDSSFKGNLDLGVQKYNGPIALTLKNSQGLVPGNKDVYVVLDSRDAKTLLLKAMYTMPEDGGKYVGILNWPQVRFYDSTTGTVYSLNLDGPRDQEVKAVKEAKTGSLLNPPQPELSGPANKFINAGSFMALYYPQKKALLLKNAEWEYLIPDYETKELMSFEGLRDSFLSLDEAKNATLISVTKDEKGKVTGHTAKKLAGMKSPAVLIGMKHKNDTFACYVTQDADKHAYYVIYHIETDKIIYRMRDDQFRSICDISYLPSGYFSFLAADAKWLINLEDLTKAKEPQKCVPTKYTVPDLMADKDCIYLNDRSTFDHMWVFEFSDDMKPIDRVQLKHLEGPQLANSANTDNPKNEKPNPAKDEKLNPPKDEKTNPSKGEKKLEESKVWENLDGTKAKSKQNDNAKPMQAAQNHQTSNASVFNASTTSSRKFKDAWEPISYTYKDEKSYQQEEEEMLNSKEFKQYCKKMASEKKSFETVGMHNAKIKEYNAFEDKNLGGFFQSDTVRHHLIKQNLVNYALYS